MTKITEFTEMLYELVGNQKISLLDALEMMVKENHKSEIGKAAEYIHKTIKNGLAFSAALRTCEAINFDEVYITFISLAEKTGSLEGVCKFLLERCRRREENTSRLIETCIYPVFVIVLAVFGALLICKSQGALANGIGENGNEYVSVSESLIKAFIFLTLFCVTTFLFIGHVFGESRLYESLLAADFLTKAGICMTDVLTECVYVAGIDSFLGREFLKAKSQIESGVDFKTAFSNIGKVYKPVRFLFQISCDEKSLFSRIVAITGRNELKKRRICLSLLEPFITAGTGIFLLIVLTGVYGNGLFGFSM